MKRSIETGWQKNTIGDGRYYADWVRAKIYKTSGGKLAVKEFLAHGEGYPAGHHVAHEPRYYRSIQGCFDALIRLGLNEGITFDDIKEVMES